MSGEGAEAMLLWPIVTPLGFLLLAAVIIVLGASSTAKYEFERNQVQAQRQRAAVGVGAPRASVGASSAAASDASGREAAEARSIPVGGTAHPAGRRRVEPDVEPSWWLIDEDPEAGQVVAGPFDDSLDAEWWGLSSGLSRSVRAVHGVPRGDGDLVRRQSPEEKAWLRELGDQLDRLPEDWDPLLSDDDALTTLVVEVAAALVEAGLPLHDCAGSGSAGGVCLTPGPGYYGVVVSWHQHERMAGAASRASAMDAVQVTMNAAVAEVLSDLGFEIEQFGSAGCVLVVDIVGRR